MKVMEKKKKPTKTLACSHALAVDVSGVIGRQIRYAALPFDKEHILPSLTVWFGFLGGGFVAVVVLLCFVVLVFFEESYILWKWKHNFILPPQGLVRDKPIGTSLPFFHIVLKWVAPK